MIIEGSLSVKAALENQKRIIHQVYFAQEKKSRDFQYIKHLCHKNEVLFSLIPRVEIDSMASGHTHGGVLAEVDYRKNETINQNIDGHALLVEGVEDPYNLGMMLRTAAAAGFKMVITGDREYQDSEAIILKASAGASEALTWIKTDDFLRTLNTLKQEGVLVVSALRSDESIPYQEFKYPDKVCLCIGGERRGLSKVVVEASDAYVHILYPNQVKIALSSVSATAVLVFEIVRQHNDS
jgi:23S rRNA (guanosine2251-2'-O)-methyltransferase